MGIGTLEEEASKESSSLSLERATRILERGRREEEGMVASKKVVVVDGAIVHRVGERDVDGDGDQLGSTTENCWTSRTASSTLNLNLLARLKDPSFSVRYNERANSRRSTEGTPHRTLVDLLHRRSTMLFIDLRRNISVCDFLKSRTGPSFSFQ